MAAKYSDLLCQWLERLGYTHCFYVAGGNIMHLLASARERFTCIPFVHEVATGIAAEYFNEAGGKNGSKAFALVTAGPGMTNLVTALAGAYLESRELLVIGGQVKTADLAHGMLRQRGIQEIDGVSIARPVSKESVRLDAPVEFVRFAELVALAGAPRKGPVFIEMPLDVQARQVEDSSPSPRGGAIVKNRHPDVDFLTIAGRGGGYAAGSESATSPHLTSPLQGEGLSERIRTAKRPVILLGGGITRETASRMQGQWARMGIPVMTTWNAADRIGADHPLYFGRPNTWGQRYANILLQQADLLVALGSRLGMQQTGFNWQQFLPAGEIIQVDIDQAELDKGHPAPAQGICADANKLLEALAQAELGDHAPWLDYCRAAKANLPLIEDVNTTRDGYLSPYRFAEALSSVCDASDTVIPCSSGGAFTTMMQGFLQRFGQTIITDKGLASMGYGLSGAIGAALAGGGRTILVEGDGGFTQNLQELGTVAVQKLPLKIFIFDDHGYASIRMTQRNYFTGGYMGCDTESGLGMPDWTQLFAAYGIQAVKLPLDFADDSEFRRLFASDQPVGFIVPIDPEQTYLPKITSRVLPGGGMASNPLHRMTPDLPPDLLARVGVYLPKDEA